LGLLQPFSDGLKLLRKEWGKLIYKVNFIIYYIFPIIVVVFMLISWLLLPWITNIYCRNFSILIIFILIRLSGFIIIIIGWESNSIFFYRSNSVYCLVYFLWGKFYINSF
jgi:NADH:ubiquinone oxidoreductase subunit H